MKSKEKKETPEKVKAEPKAQTTETISKPPKDRSPTRPLIGIVVSDKMSKTRVIELRNTQRHSLYHKNLVFKKKIFIHDEKNESKVGDKVMAIPTRPLSRHKSFRLLKILEQWVV